MTDLEQREEEILVLNSIFNNDASQFFFDSSIGIGQISVQIPVETPVEILSQDGNFTLSSLPPVTLNFSLPATYPSCSSPQFTLVCDWLTLSQLDSLSQILSRTTHSALGSPTLFLCIETLKDHLLPLLSSPISLSSLNSRFTPKQLRQLLLDFDQLQSEEKFSSTVFSCEVCFESQLGRDCIEFRPCSHVFCSSCARTYLELRIREGDVTGLKCLATKCDSELSQNTIRSLVSDDLFDRYDDLLLRRTLDSMQDIKQCPRPSCRAPVFLDPSTPTLGECSVCSLSFCTQCERTFHGVAECEMTDADRKEILEVWRDGDRERKEKMERRFGKAKLKRVCENVMAEEWIKENARCCPNCKAKIQKLDGCNKMVCSKCRAPFCWLCGKLLHYSNPYGHFNNPIEKCYNLLFEGVNERALEQEEDEDEEFFPDEEEGETESDAEGLEEELAQLVLR